MRTEYQAQAQRILGAGATKAEIEEKIREIAYTAPYQNVGDPTDPDDVNNKVYVKAMRELYERATKSDKTALNNWATEIQRLYDASMTNQNPQHFLKIFQDFQKTISAQKMRQIFDNQLVPAQRKTF